MYRVVEEERDSGVIINKSLKRGRQSASGGCSKCSHSRTLLHWETKMWSCTLVVEGNLKCEDKNRGPPVASRNKAPGESLGSKPQKLMTLFVKICYSEPVLRSTHDYINHFNIKMEEKSTWMKKSGRASNNICQLGTKSGWRLLALQLLCCQWSYNVTSHW